jgi:PAS domain S-box-containing protein
LSEGARVRAFLRPLTEELGFSPERCYDIQVAVCEATANAIEHTQMAGEVRVEAHVLADRLEVSVHGTGQFRLPAQQDGREHRGLGLPLMATLSDHLALYSVADGGTLVSLTFFLPKVAPSLARPPSLSELLAESRLVPEVLNHLPAAFMVFDEEWRYAFVNDAHVGLARKPREELLGRSLLEVFPQAATARDENGISVFEEYQRAREQDSPRRFSFHHESSERWFEYHAFPINEGLAVFARDTTEEKGTERLRRGSEERFRALVTASSEVLYRMSPDWSEMRELRGQGFLADTESLNVDWLDEYIHPADQPRVRAAVEEAIRKKSIFELEHRVRRADGSVGWTFSRAVPLKDARGEIVEWFGSARDITPRKQAEEDREALLARLEEERTRLEASLERETLLSTLLETSHQPFAAGAAEGHLILVNDAFLNLTGYSREELMGGVTWNESLTPPRWRAHEAKVIHRLRETGDPQLYEKEYVRKDGTLVPVELLVHLGESPEGEPFYYSFITDTSERKSIEREREQLLAEVQATSRQLAHVNEELAAKNTELARLYRGSKTVAETLQEALVFLPSAVPGVRFGHAYRSASETAKLGGDFFDVFPLPGGKVAVIVGDVSGKGLQAAHLASFVREAVRAYALNNQSPRFVLRLANQAFIHRHGQEHFATVALVLLDPRTGRGNYSLAGHPPPVHVRGKRAEVAGWKASPPLGFSQDTRYLTGRFTLSANSSLIFYTDGITEARRDGKMFGEDGLVRVLSGMHRDFPEVVAERILSEVTHYSDGRLRDDAAVLALKLADQH